MQDARRSDNWNSGEGYEGFVGRWSLLVARELLAWLDVAPGAAWLDVGCGPGTLVTAILELCAPGRVAGVDRSEGFVAYARSRIEDPRVEFRTGDAQDLPFEAHSFDVAVSGLVLNFVPDAESMVREMTRVVRAGGRVALYVWDYAGEMQLLRRFWDAAAALDPAAADLDEGRRFPICKPEPLAELFAAAGLGDVETRAIDVATRFRDFADYWTPFLSGQGPAPGYCMSLDDEKRTALRESLRSTLPRNTDGGIDLIARAWAVKGAVR